MEQTKKPWLSKTIWTNVILAGVAFIPSVHEWFSSNVEALPIVFTVVNILLRLITKDKIALTD